MARRVQNGIALNADFTQLASAVGALQAMTVTVKTDRFMTPVVEFTHRNLANRFDIHMDMLAEATPSRFHHVYEWRMAGEASGRLWKHQLKGRGSSNRYVSWAWKASKAPILTPEERYSGPFSSPNDPMTMLDPDQVESFNDRKYIFYWKAPVMEYNMEVHIKPKYSKQIAFPSAIAPGEIIGTDSSIVMNPGGEQTTLAFTSEWTRWWAQEAPAYVEQEISNVIRQGVQNATIEAVKRGSRKATTNINNMSFQTAQKQGERWARENLHKFSDKIDVADWYDPEGEL